MAIAESRSRRVLHHPHYLYFLVRMCRSEEIFRGERRTFRRARFIGVFVDTR
jgi:hypothetical protein